MCKGEAEESAVKVAKRKGWTETYASELRVSPYGRRGRVRYNCWAHSDLRRRWPSSDLDVNEAALWNGCSDGHHVPTESDQGKEAGSCTLDCLLHVLAEMAHLQLWLAADMPHAPLGGVYNKFRTFTFIIKHNS